MIFYLLPVTVDIAQYILRFPENSPCIIESILLKNISICHYSNIIDLNFQGIFFNFRFFSFSQESCLLWCLGSSMFLSHFIKIFFFLTGNTEHGFFHQKLFPKFHFTHFTTCFFKLCIFEEIFQLKLRNTVRQQLICHQCH